MATVENRTGRSGELRSIDQQNPLSDRLTRYAIGTYLIRGLEAYNRFLSQDISRKDIKEFVGLVQEFEADPSLFEVAPIEGKEERGICIHRKNQAGKSNRGLVLTYGYSRSRNRSILERVGVDFSTSVGLGDNMRAYPVLPALVSRQKIGEDMTPWTEAVLLGGKTVSREDRFPTILNAVEFTYIAETIKATEAYLEAV